MQGLLGNTPKHLRELYSVGDAIGKVPENRMAVTAFIGQHYSKADLHEFWDLFCEGITCGKGDPNTKGDGVTGLTSGVEAMLDIETITGIAGTSLVVLSAAAAAAAAAAISPPASSAAAVFKTAW